jgi:hypothetical protein
LKNLLITLFFSIITTTINAQNYNTQDWVVTNNGDSIFGKIKIEVWKNNPKKITFTTDKEKQYQIDDLMAFGSNLEKIYYKRFQITKHVMPISDTEVLLDNDTTIENETTWLEILVDGKVALAQYNNNQRSYYYYIKNNIATELVYGKGQKIGTEYVFEKLDFKNQLNQLDMLEKDLGDISEVLNTASYNSFSLINVFNKLNNVKAKKEKNNNYFFVGLGATTISTNIRGTTTYFNNTSTIKNTVSPLFKLGYHLKSGRKNAKFSFSTELDFLQYSTVGTKSSLTIVCN